MRALRVVGYGEDGSGNPAVILEDPDRRERFTVPADERLRAAARGDVQRLGQLTASSELESQLRPREIQARIRAGESVEQVAAAAGVALQRVERFAYPVLLERSRTAELARRAHPVRDDGPDVRTLEEVVEHTFGVRGQDYQQAGWDSWRGEDHKWVVTLSWRVGRSDITAHWTYHPGAHGGTVTPLDEAATDLVAGHLRPPRRLSPVIDFSKPDGEAEAVEAAEPSAASAPPSAASAPAVPAVPEEPDSSAPGAARTAKTPEPEPARGSSSDPGRRATKTTTGSGARSRPRTGATKPAAESAPAADGGEPTKRGGSRKGKPVMPSWEDVLLGVKRT